METINKFIGLCNNEGTIIFYFPKSKKLKIKNSNFETMLFLNNIFLENEKSKVKNENDDDYIIIHPPENYNHKGSIFWGITKNIGKIKKEFLSIGENGYFCTDFDDEGQIEQLFFHTFIINNTYYFLSIIRPKNDTFVEQTNSIINEKTVVAMVDILGFTNILENFSLADIEKQFNYIIEESLALCDFFGRDINFSELNKMLSEGTNSNNKNKSPILYGIISDSIVLYPNPEIQLDNQFIKICEFLSVFFILSLSGGWLLRGGVSYGTFKALRENSLYIGKALINAHKLEQKQNWAGIIIDDEINKNFNETISNLSEEGLLLNYDVPIKNENKTISEKHTVINWAYFYIEGINKDNIEKSINKMKFTPQNIKAQEALNKILNTSNFLKFIETKGVLFKKKWSKIIKIE